jgi:hypothetical protein
MIASIPTLLRDALCRPIASLYALLNVRDALRQVVAEGRAPLGPALRQPADGAARLPQLY